MAEITSSQEGQLPKPKTKLIWKTFFILLAITALEFVIVGVMPANLLRVGILVIMTIAKAAYIVGEFMHLRYEVKFLIWAIVLPTILLVWLLIALIVEGGAMFYS